MMPEDTLQRIKEYCKENSGSPYIWNGRTATYKWSPGKTTREGILNGVVRKLAGIDTTDGSQIWVVAGSLKIMPDGTISRFTGLPISVQRECVVQLVTEDAVA